jgi:signal peptidase II
MLSSLSQDGSISLSRSRISKNATILVVALVVFILDLLAKRWVMAGFLPGESRIVIPHLLKWTYEQNVRGAFGLFGSNAGLPIGMAILVLLIFWLSFRDAARNSLVVRVAFGMIVGGALGNIVDRVQHHFVVDFIDFYRIWPNIFNVADACITTGVILLILSSLVKPSRRRA